MTTLLLKNEIDTDPLVRGYSSMADQEVADDMNTLYRTQNRTIMSSSEIYNQIDSTEWDVLIATDQDRVWQILHMGGELNPFGRETEVFIDVFGGGSTTITNLQAARILPISRGQELGLGKVKLGHVQMARAA